MSRQHMRAGRQHGDDRVGAGDGLAGARRNGDAGCGGRRLRRIDKIEARDRMARLDEIRGHRRAHVAEADECDFGHGVSRTFARERWSEAQRERCEVIISRPAVNAAKSSGGNLRLGCPRSNKL